MKLPCFVTLGGRIGLLASLAVIFGTAALGVVVLRGMGQRMAAGLHAAMASARGGAGAPLGATIMVICNPETVSTDYDTSDRLYFEPLTFEDVMNIVETERPDGVIVQFGGQTPLNLAAGLEAAGEKILGTSPHAIQLSEDREEFAKLLKELDIPQPENGILRSIEEAHVIAERIGYPVLVRPSFVLGGRAMAIVESEPHLAGFIQKAIEAAPNQPILIDKFMEDAFEIDVDAPADGERVVVGAIMQHIQLRPGVSVDDAAEWILRAILSLLTVSGPRRRSRDGLHAFLQRFLLPAIVREG